MMFFYFIGEGVYWYSRYCNFNSCLIVWFVRIWRGCKLNQWRFWSFISEKSHRLAPYPIQTLLHVSEHMLHPCSCLWILSVDGLLPFADLHSFDIALDDSVLHPELPHHYFHHPDICTVGFDDESTLIRLLFDLYRRTIEDHSIYKRRQIEINTHQQSIIDHGHTETHWHTGASRSSGEHRRDGLPEGYRRKNKAGGGGLRAGGHAAPADAVPTINY